MPTGLTISSNITGLSFSEEETLRTLFDPATWYQLEPNSYQDYGGSVTTIARRPISASRQNLKGVVSDLESTGGFNSDLTQNNLLRLFQGFVFANAREKPSTMPLNGAAIVITSVTTGTSTFAAASGLGVFLAGHIVKTSGFSNATNNGIFVVASSTAGTVVVTGVLVTEASPPATAKIDVVGFQTADDELSIVVTASQIRLSASALDFNTLGLIVGEWLFIGGDIADHSFDLFDPGFARIKAIDVAGNYLDLDETTFTPVDDALIAGENVRIFFGTVLKNESVSNLILCKTYNLERTLGEDADGVQSEYLVGAACNEITFNAVSADKVNVDLSFVGLDYETRTGLVGVKAGTRAPFVAEDAFNTATDVFRSRLYIIDPLNLNNSSLFAYVSEFSITINNNITPTKAIGFLGGFDINAGNFDVTGSAETYFTTVAAVQAIRDNADVSLNLILSKDNTGIIFDIPLLSISGGSTTVEIDQPVKLPLEISGAKNSENYTFLSNWFKYLPNSAMSN